ncbi:major facilitator superfamily domain-containing protein, partial [Sporodiniella umbellata]
KRKWFLLSIVALQGFLGPVTSSIYIPAIAQVRHSFNASVITINATISLYVFVIGLMPLFWASFSERYGRRIIYILSTLLYILSTVGCALSNTVGLFIAMRALQATGASASQAVGAGTVIDLFNPQERGNAMGVFLLGPLIGPVVGPIVGGYINQYIGWRFIFWILCGLGGLVLLLILFFLPETSAVIIKKRKMAKINLRYQHSESLLKSMARPFIFLTKPAVIFATTPYSIAYGFMYFMIASLPQQLFIHYHFTSSQIGLSYLANGLGNAIGALVSGILSDRALAKKGVPEARLSIIWLGIIMLPTGDLIYGWCTQLGLNVFGGLVGLFLLGLGVGLVQTPSNTYISDIYPKYAASVMSTANLLRCISAGCTPLVAPTLIRAIGNGWSMTILAIISMLSGACVFVSQRYSHSWKSSNKAL